LNKRILASLVAIGVIAAFASGSTFALFSDTEASSANTFSAGQLDLKVDWNESYNGQPVETQNLTDNPGPIFDISDVKPGDHGEATVSLHLFDNPGFVWMDLQQTANLENGCSEPEAEVDDTCGNPGQGEGELGEHLQFTIWNDDGDNVMDEDEQIIFNGTAEELTDNTNGANLAEQVAAAPGQISENVQNAADNGSETPVNQTEQCRAVGGVDTALTLDRSGSMYGEPLSAAKNSSKDLVDTVNESDQIAVVSFESDATLDQELTTDKEEVKNAIDLLNASGGTDIAAGVDIAHEELVNGDNARENASKVMVVLSDGVSSTDPVPAAEAAKEDDIRIITIGLSEFADNETLQEMASSEDDFYQTTNVSELSGVFENVSRDVVCTSVNQTDGEEPEPPTPGVEDDRGLLIDADPDQEGVQPFENSTTEYVGIKWTVPRDTGNEIQTDSKQFDFEFYAEQARHNTPQDEPTPPPTNGDGTDGNDTNVSFASVNFENQTSNGTSVTVDEVNTSDGGFVAILDDGNVLGASGYIQAGVENSIQINLPSALNESQFLTAQVHEDADDDQVLDFLSSNGSEDTPYEDNGNPVTDDAFINVTNDTDDTDTNVDVTEPIATVNFENQTTDGESVTVQDVDMSEGGFVAIHNASLLDGNAVGSVIGVSNFLSAGSQTDVQVDLYDVPGVSLNQTALEENQTLIAMPHLDTDNDTTYDFVSTNGAEDSPYTENGSAVTDDAFISVINDTNVTPPNGDNSSVNGTNFIQNVELCELGSKPPFSNSSCPGQQRELVSFDWTGTEFDSNNDSVQASLTVLNSNEAGPVEVEYSSEQNVSTSVVVTANGTECSFPRSDTTLEVCS
jgi:predicted ribosomally synthesized peptide with SipW-like signal peptide